MNVLKYLLESSHTNNNKVYTSNIVFYGKEFKDDNIFFSALIAYTLKEIKDTFNHDDQILINQIVQNCHHAFNFFKNKHGGITYNFYPTKPLNQYSGIKLLNKFTALHIPDDLDTTSLVYLAQNSVNKKLLLELKQKFDQLSNDGKPLNSIPKKFQATKAYRTWFATKMNHDMDICVMCNVLCLIHQNNLTFTKVDIDAINLISKLIETNECLTKAYLYAPHYKNKTIVLYHIVRLINVTQLPQLLKHKERLIKYTKNLLHNVSNALDKVILLTSLHKLGCNTSFSIEVTITDFKKFYWFKANPFSISPPWIKTIFSQKKFLHLEYQCSPYYWVLLLELKQISNAKLKYNNNKIQLVKTNE